MITTEPKYTKRLLQEGQFTAKYLLTALVMSMVLLSIVYVSSYSYFRAQGIYSTLEKMIEAIPLSTVPDELASQEIEASDGDGQINTPEARAFSHFSKTPSVTEASIYAPDSNVLASSKLNRQLRYQDRKKADALLNSRRSYVIDDVSFYQKGFWKAILLGRKNVVPVMVALRHQDGSAYAVAKLAINFRTSIKRAERYAQSVFFISFLVCAFVMAALYYRFRMGVVTIRAQSDELNQQILSLSELLNTNNELRLSMKTASTRAVELNEQFLRRTGADLHDGPAQLIGYAVLRLNQISKSDQAKKLGQEFHAVKEALENSLEEIRGISSGLVLPELETMSLEECLYKVVSLHRSKTDCEIKEYYQNLPEDLDLPIKICAYRFIQEGLNNAERHGSAKKCRVTAHVSEDVLQLSLKDNGMGFRKSLLSQRGSHLGLLGLKDRIESIGGKFSVNSELGVGTALKLSLNLLDYK